MSLLWGGWGDATCCAPELTPPSGLLSPPQLPQCLCIHLQRLSWSSHGTPLKRHEHVQFNEFLMMDIYKYRLLGHKPRQPKPEGSESLGPAMELQEGPPAPRAGVCPGADVPGVSGREGGSLASPPSGSTSTGPAQLQLKCWRLTGWRLLK